LLAVRPAQASFRPYGLKDAVLQKSGTLFFFAFQAVRPEMHTEIPGRKAWDFRKASQGVSPEMRILFF